MENMENKRNAQVAEYIKFLSANRDTYPIDSMVKLLGLLIDRAREQLDEADVETFKRLQGAISGWKALRDYIMKPVPMDMYRKKEAGLE
jgi:hypothetical protein